MLLKEYLDIRNNKKGAQLSLVECAMLGIKREGRGWAKPHLGMDIPDEVIMRMAHIVVHSTWAKQRIKKNPGRLSTSPAEERFDQKVWEKIRNAFLAQSPVKACVYCGSVARLEVDHKLPKAAFPSLVYHPENFQLLCRSCNTKKNAFVDKRYLQELAHLL